jgi:glutamine synthetase
MSRNGKKSKSRLVAAEPSEESALLRWLKERRITEVECLVPDMTGVARGKFIPAA